MMLLWLLMKYLKRTVQTMTDKKPTDAEIVIKALKEILELMLCEGDLQKTSTISHTIDLINRLQEECDELAYKLGCLLCHATGGKLSKHTYPLAVMESYVNDTIQDYCEEATEEAYTDFAESLKKDFDNPRIQKFGLDFVKFLKSVVDNRLKEIVGDNGES